MVPRLGGPQLDPDGNNQPQVGREVKCRRQIGRDHGRAVRVVRLRAGTGTGFVAVVLGARGADRKGERAAAGLVAGLEDRSPKNQGAGNPVETKQTSHACAPQAHAKGRRELMELIGAVGA